MSEWPPKVPGHCLRCGQACYDVLEAQPEGHPRAGEPRRLGAQAAWGCQVEFALDDGSVSAVTFCIDCAKSLEPGDYAAVWRACQEAEVRLSNGQSLRHRRIVAKLGCRKEACAWCGTGTRLVRFDPNA